MVYHLLKYRRKVVFTNLKNAFPNKSEDEIEKIAKEFYGFLCDFIVESVKSITISEKEIRRRCRFEDTSLIDRLYAEKIKSIGVLGHFGNWEWASPAFSLLEKHKLFVIYKELNNVHFEKLMLNIRSRFGSKLIEMKKVVREMFKNKDLLAVTIFVSDQTPFPEDAYWTTFMNQDTPVFRGTEVMSKKFNLPVYYISVKREKRGYYVVHTEMLVENPQATADGEISELHTRRLEKDIMENPELWLWSHRRWKHKRQ